MWPGPPSSGLSSSSQHQPPELDSWEDLLDSGHFETQFQQQLNVAAQQQQQQQQQANSYYPQQQQPHHHHPYNLHPQQQHQRYPPQPQPPPRLHVHPHPGSSVSHSHFSHPPPPLPFTMPPPNISGGNYVVQQSHSPQGPPPNMFSRPPPRINQQNRFQQQQPQQQPQVHQRMSIMARPRQSSSNNNVPSSSCQQPGPGFPSSINEYRPQIQVITDESSKLSEYRPPGAEAEDTQEARTAEGVVVVGGGGKGLGGGCGELGSASCGQEQAQEDPGTEGEGVRGGQAEDLGVGWKRQRRDRGERLGAGQGHRGGCDRGQQERKRGRCCTAAGGGSPELRPQDPEGPGRDKGLPEGDKETR